MDVQKTLFTLVAASLTAAPLSAQVKGSVKDDSGTPVIAANVFWKNTTHSTITDENGSFSIKKPSGKHQLIVSFIGYENDTVEVSDKHQELEIVLHSGAILNEVEVKARKMSVLKSRGVLNQDIISSAELLRAACCNLGESFTTNPSVDVSYSDAATGAKQIKLLGLSGKYVQMLTENIPNYRGAGSPFALGYIPGPWMQSIQVSKGSSSVKNGYEAITGQINVEFKKPQAEKAVNANFFVNSKLRYEANFDANTHLNKRLSTALLGHYENQTKSHDGNKDGFLDMPNMTQWNLQNRWAWMGDNYVFQASIKALKENRTSGQSPHSAMTESGHSLYQVGIETARYEAFTKNAYIFDKEHNSNIALILSGSTHDQNSSYGHKLYDVNQKNGYASLMFETQFNEKHSLSTGVSLNHDYFNQDYNLLNVAQNGISHKDEKETVPGVYAQYSYNLHDKLIVMAGLRADHSSAYGSFVTPRAHIKYTPSSIFSLRASAGKGYRANHVLAEHNNLLASSRKIVIDDNIDQEEAWNYGLSSSLYIPIFNKTLNINAEYYYTHFLHQMVIDMDSNPHEVHFTNLDGRSRSHTFQIEATYPFFEGFSLTAAYRWSDVKATYGQSFMEQPLAGKYKGLITASYQTPLGLWQFDATLQLNGGGRMPTPYTMPDGNSSWNSRYPAFEQLSAQVTRVFKHWSVYAGGENLTGFKQKNPIINANYPWSDNFDSTMVWGPIDGAMFYAGIRINY